MKVKYENGRISVGEAANMLSMNEQSLKRLMIKGKLPIGVVDKSEKAEKNYSYRKKYKR